jgi:hypothetical protein
MMRGFIKTVENVLSGVKNVFLKTSANLVKGKIETKQIFLFVDVRKGILRCFKYQIVKIVYINVKIA